jgi:hypothetical protein
VKSKVGAGAAGSGEKRRPRPDVDTSSAFDAVDAGIRAAPVPAVPSVPVPVDNAGLGSPLVPVAETGLANAPPPVVDAELESALPSPGETLVLVVETLVLVVEALVPVVEAGLLMVLDVVVDAGLESMPVSTFGESALAQVAGDGLALVLMPVIEAQLNPAARA